MAGSLPNHAKTWGQRNFDWALDTEQKDITFVLSVVELCYKFQYKARTGV